MEITDVSSLNPYLNNREFEVHTPPVDQQPTPSKPEKALITFTCFPKLPLELRLKIWHHLFKGRKVKFQSKRGHFLFTRQLGWGTETISEPVTLRINQESRNETLLHYQLLFETSLDAWGERVLPVYFNPKLDMLALSTPEYLRSLSLRSTLATAYNGSSGLFSAHDINVIHTALYLELRNVDSVEMMNNLDKILKSLEELIKCLRGVKEIYIVGCGFPVPGWTEEKAKSAADMIKAIFEKEKVKEQRIWDEGVEKRAIDWAEGHKEVFQERTVPRVEVYPWSKVCVDWE